MLDLTPATGMVTEVVADVGDDQLAAPTPCQGMTVADLLDHLDGLCLAFTAAAAKDGSGGDQAPQADGSRLAPDWRTRIPGQLAALARAWQDETAWAGPAASTCPERWRRRSRSTRSWCTAGTSPPRPGTTTRARPSWCRRPTRS